MGPQRARHSSMTEQHVHLQVSIHTYISLLHQSKGPGNENTSEAASTYDLECYIQDLGCYIHSTGKYTRTSCRMAYFRTETGNIQDEPEAPRISKHGSIHIHIYTHTYHNDKGISNGHRSQVKEPQWPNLKQFDHKIKKVALAMAPHSSTLAWKVPWMEEPGRLQSMGSLGVGHD